MNVKEAKNIFNNVKLEFGNTQHILAYKTLHLWEEYQDLVAEHGNDVVSRALECDACDGYGEIEDYYNKCSCGEEDCDCPIECDVCGGIGDFYPYEWSTVYDIEDAIYRINLEAKRSEYGN